MVKYRKKPVVIEAMEYKTIKEVQCEFGVAKETNSTEICEWMGIPIREKTIPSEDKEGEKKLEIETLEGVMEASLGDHIIKGVEGKFCPCKPNIFKKTYEKVE